MITCYSELFVALVVCHFSVFFSGLTPENLFALPHVIEVDPINQCLSKCRLEWFVPGVEELGSRSWLYCGAVWSAITSVTRLKHFTCEHKPWNNARHIHSL